MTVLASPEARPATWRGMTGMEPGRPVATVGFLLFDGTTVELILSDRDLERMAQQIIDTVPWGWAEAYRSCLQPDNVLGRFVVDGSMPRAVGLQSPESNFARTSSGRCA